MKLAYWMYAGPAHIGTLRVASSFKNVHAIMHAPLGDDYFNVMRSMLERERDFTPVTASIVDRHVLARGSQEKVVENITRKNKEECPDLILLTPTCTSSILQEDLKNFVDRASASFSEESNSSKCDIIFADVNHYRVNELQAADRTLEQIVRFYLEKQKTQQEKIKQEKTKQEKTKEPSANILGIFTLGFHNQHDCKEIKRLLNDLGISVNEIIPEGCSINNLKNLPKAWFNIVPYREVGLMTATYLEKEFHMPYVSTTPMGVIDTATFIREIGKILSLVATENQLSSYDATSLLIKEATLENYIQQQTKNVSQAAWFARSIDCQNLTGKKAVVFGDATHAASMTKILTREMGIKVVCAGTYCKHDVDWFREQVLGYCDEILITDDHDQVAEIITKLEPAAIFGTQMERHVGKRLEIPCGVISAPIHIQNFPLGYRPFLGYEGTNQIADLVYNSFSLGMEDHLLSLFGGHDTKEIMNKNDPRSLESGKDNKHINLQSLSETKDFTWTVDGLQELNKIPSFVRSKVKEKTENYAREQKINIINFEVIYAAKEALS